jgi:hypothetical protein
MLLLCAALATPGVPAVFVDEGNQTPSQLTNAEFAAFVQDLSTLINQLRELAKAGKWEERQPIFQQIDATITGYILKQLNNSTHSAAILEKQLNEAMAQSIVGLTLEEIKKGNPDFRPFAFALEGPGKGRDYYAVGYAIGFGNVYSSIIRCFARRGTTFESVARVDPDLFENRILKPINLKPARTRELRFLAFGGYIGSPQGMLKVVLYRLTVANWGPYGREGPRPNGEVTIRDDRVLLAVRQQTWHPTSLQLRDIRAGQERLAAQKKGTNTVVTWRTLAPKLHFALGAWNYQRRTIFLQMGFLFFGGCCGG